MYFYRLQTFLWKLYILDKECKIYWLGYKVVSYEPNFRMEKENCSFSFYINWKIAYIYFPNKSKTLSLPPNLPKKNSHTF